MCAWKGCTNAFSGEKPAGWVNLLVWWSRRPEPERTIGWVVSGPSCKHDAALCPKHAAELEGLLKPVAALCPEDAAEAEGLVTDIINQLKDVKGSA
jgi:hypothetical protein